MEGHFVTRDVLGAWLAMPPQRQDLAVKLLSEGENGRRLIQLGKERLAAMDASGLRRSRPRSGTGRPRAGARGDPAGAERRDGVPPSKTVGEIGTYGHDAGSWSKGIPVADYGVTRARSTC